MAAIKITLACDKIGYHIVRGLESRALMDKEICLALQITTIGDCLYDI